MDGAGAPSSMESRPFSGREDAAASAAGAGDGPGLATRGAALPRGAGRLTGESTGRGMASRSWTADGVGPGAWDGAAGVVWAPGVRLCGAEATTGEASASRSRPAGICWTSTKAATAAGARNAAADRMTRSRRLRRSRSTSRRPRRARRNPRPGSTRGPDARSSWARRARASHCLHSGHDVMWASHAARRRGSSSPSMYSSTKAAKPWHSVRPIASVVTPREAPRRRMAWPGS